MSGLNQTYSSLNWENLLELFECVSVEANGRFKCDQPLLSYYAPDLCWPNYTIVESNEAFNADIMDQIDGAIQKKEISPFLLCSPSLTVTPRVEDFLYNYGVRLISKWPMISFDCAQTRVPSIKTDGELTIKLVDSPKEAADWSSIVSKVLFSNRLFPVELLTKARFSLVIAYLSDIPVATAMIYWGVEYPSVHMVAVLPEFRKRGFGQKVFAYSLDDAKKDGSNLIFAQASVMGTKAWLELGFKIDGYMNNFWKIGLMP